MHIARSIDMQLKQFGMSFGRVSASRVWTSVQLDLVVFGQKCATARFLKPSAFHVVEAATIYC